MKNVHIPPQDQPKQETAVEWLVNELKNQFGFVFSNNILDKAIEMEKEQIRNAYCKGEQDFVNNKVITSEQYYNETFKK
jgi:hypothetical protein